MKLNYCPECAAPLHAKNQTKYVCANGHPYWNNPRTTVTAILVKGSQALFSKRAIEPQKGKYDFPGGFVDFDEDAYQAITRELKEETGVTPNELTIIHTTKQNYIENINVCDIIFVCGDWSGEPIAADDVEALEWRPIDFIDTDQFAWQYPGLATKITNYIESDI